MLKHEIAMSRGERSVCYFLRRLPNLKQTVDHVQLTLCLLSIVGIIHAIDFA